MKPDIVKKWNDLREAAELAGRVVSTTSNAKTQKAFDDAICEWLQFEEKHGLRREMMVRNSYKESIDQKAVFDFNLSDTQCQYHCQCGH